LRITSLLGIFRLLACAVLVTNDDRGFNMAKVSRLGQRLKMFRLKADLTQEELAREANVGRNIIANLEIGARQSMLIDNAARIARALGVTLDQLYGYDILEEDDEPKCAATIA
jgi:DNA-binding XRE family transcriptional regulator